MNLTFCPLRSPKAMRLWTEADMALADKDPLALGKGVKFSFTYNVQATVDEENQIIVSSEIHSNANDSRAFSKLLDATK